MCAGINGKRALRREGGHGPEHFAEPKEPEHFTEKEDMPASQHELSGERSEARAERKPKA